MKRIDTDAPWTALQARYTDYGICKPWAYRSSVCKPFARCLRICTGRLKRKVRTRKMEQEKRYTDTCPFCGGQVILGDADCAAEVCGCSGAQHERGKKMKFEKLRAAIESICGEG